jgi:hypothetical protein
VKDRLVCKTRIIKEGGVFFIEYQEERTFFEKIFFVSQLWHTLWETPKCEKIKMDNQWVDVQRLPGRQTFKHKWEVEDAAQSMIGKTLYEYKNPDSRVVVNEFEAKGK